MTHKRLLLERADNLIAQGYAVLATERKSQDPVFGGQSFVDGQMCRRWRMQVLTLIRRVDGEASHYWPDVAEEAHSALPEDARTTLAILEALRDDIDNNMFVRVEDLVSAEVFTSELREVA